MARKLPKGIRENKGTYEARAMVNGVKICLYGSDLDHLISDCKFHTLPQPSQCLSHSAV